MKPKERYVYIWDTRSKPIDFEDLEQEKQYRHATCCPKCLIEITSVYKMLTTEIKLKFCPNCGQSIIWTVEEN